MLSLEEQIAALTVAVTEGRTASEAKLEALQQSVDNWKPVVTDLQRQVEALRIKVDRLAPHLDGSSSSTPVTDLDAERGGRSMPPHTGDGILPNPSGPDGHRLQLHTGGNSLGFPSQTVPPVTGAQPQSNPELDPFGVPDTREHVHPHHHWALPKLDFPAFDGENPQFWRSKCEKYFAVYGLQPEIWVRVATLHFNGNAARWLQVHERLGTEWTWESLCERILEKFGREHYQVLLRQFNTLKQHGSVTDYMRQFEDLMHQILAHNPAIDSLFFTTQFLEGLKSDIKSGVVLHRPRDLDTAFSLATMQEELLEALPRHEFRRAEAGDHGRFPARPLLALGPPQARPLLMAPPAAADDRRGVEGARAAERRAPEQVQGRGDDRIGALRNYRRARGLCFKCGERWGQGHQCAATVQIHVVEELLDLLQAEHDGQDGEPRVEQEDDLLMSISKLAVSGATTAKTVRLVGMIGNQELLILVDSGSSHCFISDAIAERLHVPVQAIPAAKVRIANGGLLQCDRQLTDCTWWTQGHSFSTDLRILALGCYDMVLGMDWLESMSPMTVDWVHKTLQFQYHGEMVTLQGISPLPPVPKCAPISLAQLQAMERSSSVLHMVAIFSAEQASDTNTEEIPPVVRRYKHRRNPRNTSVHSAHGMTPFQVMFGRQPRDFGTIPVEQCTVPDLASWLKEREIVREMLQQQLLRAQQRMKHQADKHRTEREFQVGDQVFLKLQPYIQTSIARRPCQKLAFRYFGPYTVLERVGLVAYKLDLPKDSQVHPVVHVSLLKQVLRPNTPVSAVLPPANDILHAIQGPVQVLSRRLVRRGSKTHPQVLVQWAGMDPALATWEDDGDLRHRYQLSPAWGHAGTEDGGNVTYLPTISVAPAKTGKRRRARDVRRRRTSQEDVTATQLAKEDRVKTP